jgi:hypothetical protein
MALRIIWRNTIPSNRGDIPVERIADNELGAVYETLRPRRALVFEVTYRCRFSRRRRKRAHRVADSA